MSHPDRGFIEHTAATATDEARSLLLATERHLGFVPAALARMVASPRLVRAFQQAMAAFEQTSLTKVEREVVVLTMAYAVGCEVCQAMHRGVMAKAGGEALLDPLRTGAPLGDERLEALRAFTRSLLATWGEVDGEAWARLLSAGFSREQALEVVLGLGTYTMSMVANRLTGAPVDEALRG